MTSGSTQYERGKSRERSPLIPQHPSTSYGVFGPVPRPPGLKTSPPHVPTPGHPGGGYQPAHTHRYQRDSSPLRPITFTKGHLGGSVIFLIILAQAVAFIFFYDLPTKLEEYSKAIARMREQQGAMRKEANHLESERIALRRESNLLEKERLALESTTLEMEGERDALESAIHHSELERSRLEREKQLLEDERQLLEQEREALESAICRLELERSRLEQTKQLLEEERQQLEQERDALESAIRQSKLERLRLEREKQLLEDERQLWEQERDALESEIRRSELERSRLEREKQLLEDERQLLGQEKEALRDERERWERAREDRVPQGAFWDPLWPAWDCRAYGKREYWGILNKIPEDWTDMDACMNMPTEIKGVSVRRPDRCGYVEGSPHIHGYWMVDWDQADCKPWHRDFHDKGCINPGSGARRIEAQVVGILNRKEQDWRLLCESTPMTWDHVTYNSPTHCDERRYGRKVAMWDIPDGDC